MRKDQTSNINVLKGDRAKILVITDSLSKQPFDKGEVMSKPAYELFLKEAARNGFEEEDFVFVTPCPPIPIEYEGSDSKIVKFITECREEFLGVVEQVKHSCLAVLTLGKIGNRQLMGKAVQITKARGTFCTAQATGGLPVLPLLGPFHVLRRPELREVYDSDFRQLAALRDANWDLEELSSGNGTEGYRWCNDISHLLSNPPKGITLDCETVGLDWHSPDFRILTISITNRKGVSYVMPVDVEYATNRDLHGVHTPEWMATLTEEDIDDIKYQIRTLLSDPNVSVSGHNLKYDIHALSTVDIEVSNWFLDTMQLAFAVDENMTSKSLDDCARRWVPTHAGYADCVAPETEILMADMSYKTAGELKSGDELCAFTKDTKGKKAQRREMGISVVRKTQRIERPCLKITTESGRSIIVSVGHLFLSKRGEYEKGGGWRWRRADELKVGSVLKPFPWEKQKTDYDAGWVSGIIDGEGWLCTGVSRMGVSQKPNSILDRFKKLVEMSGVKIGHSTDKRKKVHCVNLTFDSSECFKMLQMYRPMRLIESRKWVGCGLPTNGMKHDVIVSIEDVGVREVIGLSTSTQTIISNGLLSHNSFNKKTDKSRMDLVPHDEMLEYAGGDTDVTYRLTQALLPLAKEDTQNYECFIKVQMPALRTFVAMERVGVRIDKDALLDLGRALDERSEQLRAELLSEVPEEVLKEFEGEWNFGSAKFLVACLFGPNAIRDPETGKKLKPVKFTASTEKLPPSERVPSVSIKDHLPYFEHIPFVRKLMEFSKLQKVRSTYVGHPSSFVDTKVNRLTSGSYSKSIKDILDAHGIEIPKSKSVRQRVEVLDEEKQVTVGSKTLIVDRFGNITKREKTESAGFWQYMTGDSNLIHSSFVLHATNTGRTASRNPNMQNTPKRGDMAKSFRKIFLPPIEGWKFLELDYSQIELRVAAWMAREKNMIQIYKDGGDIHSSTAAAVTNIPIKDFLKYRKDTRLLIELEGRYSSVDNYIRTMSKDKKSKMTIKEYFDLLRYQAKAVNFGYLYGMWWKGFKVYAKTDYGIDYTDEEAEATRVRFFKNYPALERWHKSMKSMANEKGYVRALHGALRRLPNVDSFDESIIGGAERQAVNAPVQRFASDLGLIAVSRLFRDAPKDKIRPVLFIHDAIVPCVHPDYVEEAASAIKYYMENPPLESWFGIVPPFPLTADVSCGDNLGEMHEMEGIVAKKPDWFQSGEEPPSAKPDDLNAWAIKKKRGIIVTD